MQPQSPDDFRFNPYASPATLSELPNQSQSEDLPVQGLAPFLSIWFSPRQTIRSIVNYDPRLHVLLLACLGGIQETLGDVSDRNTGNQLPLASLLLMALAFGAVRGLLGIWIGAWLYGVTGKWIGGIGNYQDLRAAIAWAGVPMALGLVLWIPLLMLLGPELFNPNSPALVDETYLALAVSILAFAAVVLGIWNIVLLCNTVAEVQGFRSAWKGLGNVLLAGFVILVPIMMIVLGLVFFLRI